MSGETRCYCSNEPSHC